MLFMSYYWRNLYLRVTNNRRKNDRFLNFNHANIINNPPKSGMMNDEKILCRRCGSENLIKKGYAYSTLNGTRKQKYQCKDCGMKNTSNKAEMVEEMPFEYQEQPLPERNWKAITEAQIAEKQMSLEILEELFSQIEIIVDPEKKGRKNFNPKDILFALAIKTLNRSSGRRSSSDIE